MTAFDVNGVQLSVTEQGRGGVPLVLLHAFPVDRRMWEAQAADLSDRFRVITPDFRGFGQSPNPAGAFTIDTLADDVHALLRAMHAAPAVVAGCSMGGYVALALAARYPADLNGLILVDTKAEADTPEAKQGRQKLIDLATTAGAKAVADQMLPKLVAQAVLTHRPHVAATLRAMMEACPPDTIAHALVALRDRPDRSGELASIKVPTLILVGEQDQPTPPHAAEAMHAKIAGSMLTIVPGAGHLTPVEQPEFVTRAIRQFMAKL
jgi:3-oxoadipate enol-lactonase